MNHKWHLRTKHLNCRLHHFLSYVPHSISIQHIPTDKQPADILTKAVDQSTLHQHRSWLMGWWILDNSLAGWSRSRRSVKIIRKCHSDQSRPRGIKKSISLSIPSTTNNLMGTQGSKFSAPQTDYTNITNIFDPKMKDTSSQTSPDTCWHIFGLVHDPLYGKAIIPQGRVLYDSKRDRLDCSRLHTHSVFYNL